MRARLRFSVATLALVFLFAPALPAQQPEPAWESKLQEAEALWKQKDVRTAERVFLQAFDLASDTTAVPDADFAAVAHRLGQFYLQRKKYEQALHYLTQAELALVRTHGLDHISLAPVLDDLAFLYAKSGRLRNASRAPGRQRIGDTRPNRGTAPYEQNPHEPGTLTTQPEMSIGPPGAVRPSFFPNAPVVLSTLRRALAIRMQHLGPSHPDVAVTLRKTGEVLLQSGRAAPAAESLRRALGIQETAQPPAGPELALTLETYAQALRKLGRKDEARQYEQRLKQLRAAPRKPS